MFRFTIRDVLWLIVVVCVFLAWRFERRVDVVRWKREAEARNLQFHSLLGQLEQAMPEAVNRRDDGQITVKTIMGSAVTYPNSDVLQRQLSD
jgi:hypothetical protein